MLLECEARGLGGWVVVREDWVAGWLGCGLEGGLEGDWRVWEGRRNGLDGQRIRSGLVGGPCGWTLWDGLFRYY